MSLNTLFRAVSHNDAYNLSAHVHCNSLILVITFCGARDGVVSSHAQSVCFLLDLCVFNPTVMSVSSLRPQALDGC